jgi:phage terminase large subunit GpA-like protein
MDHLGKTSDAQEIVFMKGSQIGATEAALCFVGYSIHMNPSIILLVMPTDEAIKKTSRTRIKPMLEATPVLRDKVKPAGGKDSENTINSKSFEGGVLMMVGSNSPVGLASTPAAKLLLDEIDRFPLSSGSEGSPIQLARARSRTFANRKLLLISTPTTEGVSAISDEFQKGDQRYYNVSCIFCADFFIITFDLLTWEIGDPETVRLACPHCGGLHEERHKTILLAEEGYGGKAKWVPTKQIKNKRKHSYHLSALYSPAGFYSWAELIADYEDIKGDVNLEQTFVNTVLGETYKIKGDAPDSENLYNRREDYPIGVVPAPVYLLTMGVDVQQDRLECEVVGWTIGRVTYSIQYSVLYGDTSKDEVWGALRELIDNHFEHADGSLMPIKLTCIDSGFNTVKVYDFCTSVGYNRTVPVKGMDGLDVMVSVPKVLTVTKSGKKIGSAKVWGVGVSLLKSELYGFLKLPAKPDPEGGPDTYPPGYCHFPQYDRNYFQMLTAEQLQMLKDKKTKKVSYQWVKVRDRNEALDCRIYARAAAYILGVDRFKETTWEKIKASTRIVQKAPEGIPAVKKPTKKRGGYWDRK